MNEIAITNCRIPLEFRTDKQKAISLLEEIERTLKRDEIINNDLFALAAWAGKSFFEFNPNVDFSIVKNCISRGKKPTWDLSMSKTHSLTVNGIICHNTTNLPREATHELISNIYMNAWKNKCKGITVYRDGCRSGVLLTGKESNNWFNKIPDEELNEMIAIGEKFSSNMSDVYLSFIASAKKELNNRHMILVDDCNHTSQIKHVLPRPKKLPCDLHRIKVMTNGESETYLVLVGLNDKIPYEMFCGLADHIMLPKKLTKGFIIKNGKKLGCTTYNLMLPIAGCDEEGIMFNDIVELFANRTYGAFSRQLSLGLRHQIPIHHIVEQLLKDKQSDMTSFNRVIARVLKTYIPDGTKVNGDKVCPECKQESMIYSEGCVKCVNCGFSKCG